MEIIIDNPPTYQYARIVSLQSYYDQSRFKEPIGTFKGNHHFVLDNWENEIQIKQSQNKPKLYDSLRFSNWCSDDPEGWSRYIIKHDKYDQTRL